MTTKILAFYDFIGMVAASPLECRWQIDQMTGVITACWIDSSAKGRVQ
jgi:hypothetical protein